MRRPSQALAVSVASAVAAAMKIADVRVLSGLGAVAYSPYVARREQPFNVALIECGARDNRGNVQVLSDTPQIVARAIVEGIMTYFRPGDLAAAVVRRRGRLDVKCPGALSRSAPSRAGQVLRSLEPAVLITDGYTEGGQRVAGSSRWYHLARESGHGWVHSSVGRYHEG